MHSMRMRDEYISTLRWHAERERERDVEDGPQDWKNKGEKEPAGGISGENLYQPTRQGARDASV
jgi:hypothetical protein